MNLQFNPDDFGHRRTPSLKVGIGILAALLLAMMLAGTLGGSTSRPSTPTGEFDQAVRDGADCPELYEIRNRIDRETGHEHAGRMNDRLRAIGCYSSFSTREGS